VNSGTAHDPVRKAGAGVVEARVESRVVDLEEAESGLGNEISLFARDFC
jgi:hypothetical protein